MKRLWTIITLCTLCGCMSTGPIEPVVTSSPAPAKIMSPATPPPSNTIGTSVQARPITITTFGPTDRPVLIMGGIHGDETTSVHVAQQLILQLQQSPPVTPVVVIPVANPDGFAAQTRQNSHGVDLNRNFPAKNWKKGQGRRNNGGEPLSEPESRAIASTIDTLRPRLIISIHSIDDDRHCNNYDGPAEQVARLMSQYNHYPVAPTIGYPTPGSLGSFAGIDRAIPMITLELPRHATGPQAWQTNKDALLAAIASSK